MAGNIRLEVVTPDKSVVSDEAQTVVAPGAYGEFGVLPGHTSFLTTLKIGMLRYKDKTGSERIVFVSGGFAEVLPDKVTILAESAERRRDIDVERARAALRRAEERLAEARKREDLDFNRAQAALQRALARVKVAEAQRAG
ncbi:MAG: F0F1 ATP synthase subunit epsilon [Deltaproteobacteria bacterium]|nr:F0F1 ATP synthase subunit epsilon [Deltaproteobacteria bacterium]MBW2019674.1 F0F1 ATP synthase subunit epsilon [Deltaproteobacteria bacterium]MBW2074454.1 F0F1 ATP synthase subunit epsilon [Deltaproteobacteria bacterium]RLB81672.1 MAG: F0F1 ATP synthase subunit epsilon [Deltaproteobacteria bacterium]